MFGLVFLGCFWNGKFSETLEYLHLSIWISKTASYLQLLNASLSDQPRPTLEKFLDIIIFFFKVILIAGFLSHIWYNFCKTPNKFRNTFSYDNCFEISLLNWCKLGWLFDFNFLLIFDKEGSFVWATKNEVWWFGWHNSYKIVFKRTVYIMVIALFYAPVT